MPPRPKLTRIALLVLVLALAGFGLFQAYGTDPFAQLHGQTSKFDWKDDELTFLGGGYFRGMLSMTVSGSYRSLRADRPGVVHLRLERATPFSSWTIADYRLAEPGAE